ncbi:hypothetical protein N7470_000416 [Penicillium chermesinum]|nr:hypothetical protein N7470_000416 [Penicillium chermesinum]
MMLHDSRRIHGPRWPVRDLHIQASCLEDSHKVKSRYRVHPRFVLDAATFETNSLSLCPLINSASLLQLESSLAAFKDEYPPVSSESATSGTIQSADGQSKASPIPEGAHRPLGTLHLTLGVMYLPSPERLRAAIGLFQSLDLAAIMREAESLAIPPDDAARPWHTEHSEHKAKPLTSPLSVSLESLHPLPTARKATVLYVEPFDPTGRLWAFCVLLRRHFIKAGFIEGGQHPPGKGADLTSQRPGEVADEGARPLLLHATIVNTSYVRRKPARSKSQNSPKEPKRLEMDVRSLLKHYQSYYADEARTVRQEADASSDTSLQASGESPAEQLRPKYPFVWAKDVPIQSVCICQMGAKDISADNPVPGDLLDGDQFKFENLPARLGQQYAVISKQDLNFWEA